MKIETKFGLGEIVSYTKISGGIITHDELLEVTCINVYKQAICYVCRYPNGCVSAFEECDLSSTDGAE